MADRPLLVRIPDELRRKIENRAKENDRTVSAEVRRVLKRVFTTNAAEVRA